MKKRVLVLRLAAWVALGGCAIFVTLSWSPWGRTGMWIEQMTGDHLRRISLPGPYFAEVCYGEITIYEEPLRVRVAGSHVVIPHVARIPVWPLYVVPGVVGLMCLLLSFRRPPRGFCRQCSYDLTGNVSGVCPECGTAIVWGTPA